MIKKPFKSFVSEFAPMSVGSVFTTAFRVLRLRV